jgi:hypothetical protein
MGKLRRYKVIESGVNVVYMYTTSQRPHEEVLEELDKKFKGCKKHYKVFCNGEHCHSINYRRDFFNKVIYDTYTGKTFEDINEFKDHYGISIEIARYRLTNSTDRRRYQLYKPK